MTQSIKEKLREVSREFRWKPYPISDFISLLNKAADSLDEKDKMQVEIDKLRQLAATCYAGLGGECNLPEAWLDALNKAANGEDFSTEGLLPYQSHESKYVEAQWQARVIGNGEWINVFPTPKEPTQEIRAKYLESIRSNAGNQVYEIRVLYSKED